MMPEAEKRILVVEDDEYIQEALGELLELEGYKVVSARNGQEALDLLQGNPQKPDLILLDIAMPIMDGYAFRRAQEANHNIASIPTLAMSADGNLEAKKDKLRLQEYLKKPLDIEQVLAAVKRNI